MAVWNSKRALKAKEIAVLVNVRKAEDAAAALLKLLGITPPPPAWSDSAGTVKVMDLVGKKEVTGMWDLPFNSSGDSAIFARHVWPVVNAFDGMYGPFASFR